MRLAIVTTHPIQYYAPWFRWIAANTYWTVKVFYLSDFGVNARKDTGFGRLVQWDVPLLEGYEYDFVPNLSRHPSTTQISGLRNPELLPRLNLFQPNATLLIGYKHWSLLRVIFASRSTGSFPLLFRGDSHRLASADPGQIGHGARVKREMIASVYRRFAGILYVGEANRDYFRLHGVPDDKLWFSPHAVDNDRFIGSTTKAGEAARRWRSELGIPGDNLVVLFAGKFEAKKRPLDLLAAFTGLRQGGISLLFVGNGELEGELRRRAVMSPNVFFAPFQNQSEMPKVYAACDLFVLPSYGPEESWGLAVNEALCLRRPVILSDHVGCGPDLVEHGRNGLVFPAGDVKALAESLREALSNRDRLQLWGEAGFSRVAKYDYPHAMKGLELALQAVTAG